MAKISTAAQAVEIIRKMQQQARHDAETTRDQQIKLQAINEASVLKKVLFVLTVANEIKA